MGQEAPAAAPEAKRGEILDGMIQWLEESNEHYPYYLTTLRLKALAGMPSETDGHGGVARRQIITTEIARREHDNDDMNNSRIQRREHSVVAGLSGTGIPNAKSDIELLDFAATGLPAENRLLLVASAVEINERNKSDFKPVEPVLTYGDTLNDIPRRLPKGQIEAADKKIETTQQAFNAEKLELQHLQTDILPSAASLWGSTVGDLPQEVDSDSAASVEAAINSSRKIEDLRGLVEAMTTVTRRIKELPEEIARLELALGEAMQQRQELPQPNPADDILVNPTDPRVADFIRDFDAKMGVINAALTAYNESVGQTVPENLAWGGVKGIGDLIASVQREATLLILRLDDEAMLAMFPEIATNEAS